MTWMEIVKERRSVRSFDGKALSDEHASDILEFARNSENPYGLEIEYRLLKASELGLSSPVIVGTDLYIAGKMKKVPHAEEAFGYSFEQAVLHAQELGVGTTWIAGTMNREMFEKAMEVGPDEVMPCVSPLGYPAQRKSIREVMMRKAIKADSRLGSAQIFFDEGFEKPFSVESDSALGKALELVRLAPSAVNKQPWRLVICKDCVHFYEKHSLNGGSGDWDIQKIDMGIALYHFALGMPDARFEIQDPKLKCPEGFEYIASFAI